MNDEKQIPTGGRNLMAGLFLAPVVCCGGIFLLAAVGSGGISAIGAWFREPLVQVLGIIGVVLAIYAIWRRMNGRAKAVAAPGDATPR